MDCPVDGNTVVQPHDLSLADANPEAASSTETAEFSLDGDQWRSEVAARLQRYRSRRKPREPRYPSLRLPFASGDHWSQTNNSALAVASVPPELTHPVSFVEEIPVSGEPHWEAAAETARPRIVEYQEQYANVIEFPRWAAIPARPEDELAEPIVDRPRIVEAPEILPPPPALGGIMIEPATRDLERNAAADLGLAPASLPRRMLAGMIDGFVLVAALAVFGGICFWMDSVIPPKSIIAGSLLIVGALIWAAYQFLFLVYTGSTPGIRLARLQLTRFDGSPASRSRRRCRALASYVSGLALGLGYLWSVLDEDGLCWHDRITRTCVSGEQIFQRFP